MVNHSLDYDSVFGENKDIELLNYRYGDSKAFGTRPQDSELKDGHIAQGISVHGLMPVADYLYVKWRVQSTGGVYEDTVDLKSRFPADMEHKIVHFSIKDLHLYVYVIEGETAVQLHAKGAQNCPAISYEPYKCTRIYPDSWKNF